MTMVYVSKLMITTKQRSTIYTQKLEENQSIPLHKIINSQRKTIREERNKGTTNSQKTVR